ncbi:hypothetical protein ES703_31154 [subsurface metagenome]
MDIWVRAVDVDCSAFVIGMIICKQAVDNIRVRIGIAADTAASTKRCVIEKFCTQNYGWHLETVDSAATFYSRVVFEYAVLNYYR